MNIESIDVRTKHDDLMEQYKLIANSYESSRAQRLTLNQAFVFLFSAIVGLYNFLISRELPMSQTEVSYSVFIIGIVVGIFWSFIILQAIKSEKNKYKIIYEIENQMPIRLFSVPYNAENRSDETKLFDPGYLELALPFFMIAVLAVNCVLFAIHTIHP